MATDNEILSQIAANNPDLAALIDRQVRLASQSEHDHLMELHGYLIRPALAAAKISPLFYDHAHQCWLCYSCRLMQIGPQALIVPGKHSDTCAWFLLWRMAREFNHEPWARHGNRDLDTLQLWYWQLGVEGHEAIGEQGG